MLLVVFRLYPRRTTITMLCLVLAGFAEGVGVSSVLPLIRMGAPGGAWGPGDHSSLSSLEKWVHAAFAAVGVSPTVHALFAIVVGGVLLKAVLVLLANRQVGYTVAYMATSLRLELIRALLATRWSYYVYQPLGVIANSVALEAQSAAEAYLRATGIVAFFVQAGVYAAVACLVSWPATLGALAGGVVISVILGRLVRMARRAGKRQTLLARSLLARLTDTLGAVKPLKAMAREPLIGPVLEHETHRLNDALEREVMSRAALEALQEPLVVLFLVAALYSGLSLLVMPFANIVVLVFLCARVLSGLGKLQREYQKMASREAVFWAVRDLIRDTQAAAEVITHGRQPHLRQEIRLEGVAFAYDQTPVLREASVTIPGGSLTVITGLSGAGKTTLVDLIIGLLQPTAGAVRVDGVPLPELDTRAWRMMIGYVPQETLMLHESVAMNVTLGDPAVSREEVVAALQAAGAWEFVSALPEGMDTAVGERGLRLSGGQRQRLALARALVRQPALLILDEATTALDPETERGICDTLQTLRGSMTLVAICHQGHLIEVADQVYRVAEGYLELVRSSGGPPSRSAASA